MLRGNLQLAGDVVLHQLGKERLIFVLQHIIVADAAADEDLFHPGDIPQLAQQGQIVGVVRVNVGAGGGGQTALLGAHAVFQLLCAGGVPEVGGRAAYIVDIALEIRESGQGRHLPDYALMAAGSDHPALMEGQGTEVAAPEAAPVVDNGEFDLFNGGHAAHRLVHGVVLPGIGQLRHKVQLLRAQGHGGRVDNEVTVPMLLDQGLAPDRIVLLILHPGGVGVIGHAAADRLEGGQGQAVIGADGRIADQHGRAPDVRQGAGRLLLFQPPGDLPCGVFPHAVDQNIRPGVCQGAAADLVVPVIIVGKAAQGSLQPADDNGQVGKGLPGPVGVHDHRVVGAQSRLLAGGVEVLTAALFGGGVVGHHGVQVAGADHHAQAGPAHSPESLRRVPVRLGQHRHPVALRLQYPADHRRAEAGVIHIGVAGDQQKVVPPPAALLHVRFGHGQKFKNLSHSFAPSLRNTSRIPRHA